MTLQSNSPLSIKILFVLASCLVLFYYYISVVKDSFIEWRKGIKAKDKISIYLNGGTFILSSIGLIYVIVMFLMIVVHIF